MRGWDAVNKREIIGRADGTPAGAGGGGSPLGGLGEAASGALGAASQAASGAMGGVQQAAQQAIGAAASEVGSQVQSARQTALGAVPPELRGAAEAGLEYGLAQGKALAEEYLGSEATKALSALALGNSADLAQVGMELGSKVVEKAFGEAGSLVVTQHPVHTQAEAEALAKSIFAELTAGNLQAEGKAIGNPDLGAGCKVKLNGLGNKFSGEYFVTHTRHLYDAEEGYLTEFSISGRNPNTMEDLLFGGSGSNPGMKGNGAPSGVVIGIVTNNNDPEGQGRVKVKFPWLANDQESNWARVSSPMGGASRGFFVLPEVDDEVLVMFEQGDVNIPYIVGSLWNGTDKPPISSSDAVNSEGKVVKRVWKTRTGHTITLNDSDDSPGIQIIDQTGNNRIEIDSKNNQLTISLEGDIMMKAKGKINLEAQNDLSIQAQGGLNLKANSNIEIESNASIKIKGITVDLN